jgi:O-antigen ligase
MPIELLVYVIVSLIGIIIIFLSLVNFSLGFSIFLFIYPIIYTVPVIVGWEAFPISRFIISLLFSVALFKLKPYWREIPFKNIIYSYSFFIFILIMSAMLSSMPWETFTRSITNLVPIMFFICSLVSIIDDRNGLTYIFMAILSGLALTSLYGLIEISLQRNFLVDIGIITQDYDWMTDIRLGFGRITSFLGQPVYAALYFVFIIPVAYFILEYFIKLKLVKLLIVALILCSVICIIYTGSRTGIVGLCLVMFIYIALCHREWKFAKWLPIIVLLFGSLYYFAPGGFTHHTIASFELTDPAQEESQQFFGRLAVTGAMIDIAKEHIFFGFGPGFILKMKAAQGIFTEVAGMENQYAALLADSGLLGFFAYFIFLFTVICSSKIVRSSTNNFVKNWGNMVLSILVVLIITSATYEYIDGIIFQIIMVFLGIEVGLYYIDLQGQHS